MPWFTPRLEGNPHSNGRVRPCSWCLRGLCTPPAVWGKCCPNSKQPPGVAGEASCLWPHGEQVAETCGRAGPEREPGGPQCSAPQAPALGSPPPSASAVLTAEAPQPLPCLLPRNRESVPDDLERSRAQLHFKEIPAGSPHLQGRGGEGPSLPAPE